MTIERARARAHEKPWGVAELQPWSSLSGEPTSKNGHPRALIGEVWFERADATAERPALLLKLLFTSRPLSIQVHPDDLYARSLGQPNGKTEAWYVLYAAPEAKVALGLTGKRTARELRTAIGDGSLAQLIAWRNVNAGDAIFVPAGTIHAVGADLVIAEIQQRSDTTFRLYDQGRDRELHIDQAIAVAIAGPAQVQQGPRPLSSLRTLLVSSPYFILERIEFAPNSTWSLNAGPETWLFVLSGRGQAGSLELVRGDAVFAQSDTIGIATGEIGLECLVAYIGESCPDPDLLELRESSGSPPCQMPVLPPDSKCMTSTLIASSDRGRRLHP